MQWPITHVHYNFCHLNPCDWRSKDILQVSKDLYFQGRNPMAQRKEWKEELTVTGFVGYQAFPIEEEAYSSEGDCLCRYPT